MSLITHIDTTYPFADCPNLKLSQSETTASICDKNCNTVLYDDQLNEAKCVYNPRNFDSCMDEKKSQNLFENIYSQKYISTGKCGNLNIFYETVNICTPAMDSLVGKIMHDNTNIEKVTLAKNISEFCKFPQSY